MKLPVFACHDVLQTRCLSERQLMVMKRKGSLFSIFKAAMKPFEKIPVRLLVVAEGIEKNLEWIEFIKENLNYELACHGWNHIKYRDLPLEVITEDLKKAKEATEQAFGKEVLYFYPPFSLSNNRTKEAAKKAGMSEVRGMCNPKKWLSHSRLLPRVDFHYWWRKDMVYIKEILERL